MSTMSVKKFIRVAPVLPASTSLMVRGDHGIGKSMLGRQIAMIVQKNEGLAEYPVIDRRLSQVTAGDIIGLPSTEGKVTRFNPPDWYMQACKEPCFLFLDELNRAEQEVMQAAFQIVLDRELNGWKLHPQTRVMTAINTSAMYNVNEVDPALLNRFWVVDLELKTEEWVEWARSTDAVFGGSVAEVIVDFIAQDEKWLRPPATYEPGKVQATPRSWDRCSKALVGAKVIDYPDNDLFYQITLGYVGVEAANALVDYAKSVDLRFTGDDVLNDYVAKVRPKIKGKRAQELMNSAIEKLAELTEKLDTLTEAQGKNIAALVSDIPKELRVSAWTKLMKDGEKPTRIEFVRTLNKHIKPLMIETFAAKATGGAGVTPSTDLAEKNANENDQKGSAPDPDPVPKKKAHKRNK